MKPNRPLWTYWRWWLWAYRSAAGGWWVTFLGRGFHIPERKTKALRAAAERVCWFDWSNNDPDAVAAIEALRKALGL